MKDIKERSDVAMSSPLGSGERPATKPSNKILCKFEQFCEGFVQDIGEERDIDLSELNNFSMLTTYILRRNINPGCESFNELYNTLKDYANSEYSFEKNYRRGRSYIQLYQLITMTRDFFVDREQKEQAHKMAKSNLFDVSVIKAVYENPCCTFAELKSDLFISSEGLSEKLALLVKHHILISRRTGEWQNYQLTHLGNIVYEELFSDKYNIWADKWDQERISCLIILLQYYSKIETTILVQDILDQVSAASRAQIASIMSQINAMKIKQLWELVYSPKEIELNTQNFYCLSDDKGIIWNKEYRDTVAQILRRD